MKLQFHFLHSNNFKQALRVLRNKYVIASLFFVVWLIFFDSNSLVERMRLNGQTRELEREVVYYQNLVNTNNERLHELKTDNENLEKFAREQYLMKRANEDIYLIVE